MSEEKIKELEAKLKDALEGIEKVKAKNGEVIQDNKKLKSKLADIEKEKEEAIRLEQEKRLKDEGKLEELHNLKMEELQKQLETSQGEIATFKEQLGMSKSELRKLVVEDNLTKKFMEAGVTDPALLKACVTLHSTKAEMDKAEDGSSVAVIDGKPLDDYIESWKVGEGKSFISSGMSGGGAGGGSNGGAGGGEYEQYFKPETVNLTKQNELKNKDKEMYDQLKAKYPTVVNPLVAR